MYRTVFRTLWERARVGWFENVALKCVNYHMWSGSSVQVWCMRQGAQDWCTGMTLRDGSHPICFISRGEYYGCWTIASSVQFTSVAQLCLTLCDSVDCSMPGFPVHHQFLKFTQTHTYESVMPSNHGYILMYILKALHSRLGLYHSLCSPKILSKERQHTDCLIIQIVGSKTCWVLWIHMHQRWRGK